MNHLRFLENRARKSNNLKELQKIAKFASNIAIQSANAVNKLENRVKLAKKAANIRRIEVNHRLGRRIGRFKVYN